MRDEGGTRVLSAAIVSEHLLPPKAEKTEKAVTSVKMRKDLMRALDAIAAEGGRSRASLIEYAIERYVSWYQEQKKPKK